MKEFIGYFFFIQYVCAPWLTCLSTVSCSGDKTDDEFRNTGNSSFFFFLENKSTLKINETFS